MVHFGDITKVDGGKIPPVHVITFGSPCQNLSLIGNRSGLAGAKSSLFYQAFRIIQEMRDATEMCIRDRGDCPFAVTNGVQVCVIRDKFIDYLDKQFSI